MTDNREALAAGDASPVVHAEAVATPCGRDTSPCQTETPAFTPRPTELPIGVSQPTVCRESLLPPDLTNCLSEGVFLVRISDQTIVYANPRMEAMFGYGRGEMIGRYILTVNAPGDPAPAEVARRILSELNRHRIWRGEVHNVRKDGTTFWCHASVMTCEDHHFGPVWISVHTDISALKAAQDRLHARNRQLEHGLSQRDLVLQTPMADLHTGVLFEDPDGRIAYVNRRLCEMFAVAEPPEAMLGRPSVDLVENFARCAENPEGCRARTLWLRANGAAAPPDEVALVDGRVIERTCAPMGAGAAVGPSQPPLAGHLWQYRDMTGQRQREADLRRTQALLHAVINGTDDAVVLTDCNNKVLLHNAAAMRWCHLPTDSMQGAALAAAIPSEPLAQALSYDCEVAGTGRPSTSEHETRNAAGDARAFSSTRYPCCDGQGGLIGTVAIVRDITEAKLTEKLRDRFVEAVVLAQDEERRRLARELHDDTGSALTSLALELRTLEQANTLEQARERIRRVRESSERILTDVGRLARGLHPLALDQFGFAAALQQYAAEFSRIHGIRAHVQVIGIDRAEDLHAQQATALYRVIQEALNNVAKHARAQNVSVTVIRNDDEIRAAIEDDGRGNTAALAGEFGRADQPWQGLGLQGIRERVALLRGRMDIESTPGGGTTIMVQFPGRGAQMWQPDAFGW